MSEKATSDGPPTPVPPPLSPPRIRTSLSRTKLTFPGVANLFVSLKRAQVRGAAAAAAKPHHIVSTSGDEPLTHPALAPEEAVSPRQVELSREDTFVCTGGVDAAKLVRVVRDNLLQNAISVGANVLIKEQCVTIDGLFLVTMQQRLTSLWIYLLTQMDL